MLRGEPRQSRAGDSHLGPSAPAPGCFGLEQHAEPLRKDPGLGSDLRTQRGRTKDVTAAARQGLPEAFLTKNKLFCLGRLSMGGCCGEGWR